MTEVPSWSGQDGGPGHMVRNSGRCSGPCGLGRPPMPIVPGGQLSSRDNWPGTAGGPGHRAALHAPGVQGAPNRT